MWKDDIIYILQFVLESGKGSIASCGVLTGANISHLKDIDSICLVTLVQYWADAMILFSRDELDQSRGIRLETD